MRTVLEVGVGALKFRLAKYCQNICFLTITIFDEMKETTIRDIRAIHATKTYSAFWVLDGDI